MQRYTATAVNPQGQTVHVMVRAHSRDDAERILGAKGHTFILIH